MKVKKSDYLKHRQHSKIVAKMILNGLNQNETIKAFEATDDNYIELSMSAKYQTPYVVIYHEGGDWSSLTAVVETVLDELEIEHDCSDERNGFTTIDYSE